MMESNLIWKEFVTAVASRMIMDDLRRTLTIFEVLAAVEAVGILVLTYVIVRLLRVGEANDVQHDKPGYFKSDRARCKNCGHVDNMHLPDGKCPDTSGKST